MVTMAEGQGHILNQQRSNMNCLENKAISASLDTSLKDTLLVSWPSLAFVSYCLLSSVLIYNSNKTLTFSPLSV